MDDHLNQRTVPEAFAKLHTAVGRVRPNLPRDELLHRHELCEDLAQMLSDTARATMHDLGITEADVLNTMRKAIPGTDLDLSEGETEWVIGRIAELQGWLDERGTPPR